MSVLVDDASGTRDRGGRADEIRRARAPRVPQPRTDPARTRGRARHPGVRPAARPARVHAPRVARPAVRCATPVRPRRWPWLLVAGLSAFLGVVGVGTLAEGAAPPVPERTTVVSIAPGETLWQVADRLAPRSEPQAVVDRIQELNGLPGSEVRAGQVVTVPYQSGNANG